MSTLIFSHMDIKGQRTHLSFGELGQFGVQFGGD